MSTRTFARPAAEFVPDTNTDYEHLLEFLKTCVPPLPTDTGHDKVFVKNLELAAEELRLRLCEAHIDELDQHPLSLWALHHCLALLHGEYALRIYRDNERELDVTVDPRTGRLQQTTSAQDHPTEILWDSTDETLGVRHLARTNPITFIPIHDSPLEPHINN